MVRRPPGSVADNNQDRKDEAQIRTVCSGNYQDKEPYALAPTSPAVVSVASEETPGRPVACHLTTHRAAVTGASTTLARSHRPPACAPKVALAWWGWRMANEGGGA